jgi:hypothetical protein
MPFSFDRAYDENTEQRTLFEYVGLELLEHAFNGFNTVSERGEGGRIRRGSERRSRASMSKRQEEKMSCTGGRALTLCCDGTHCLPVRLCLVSSPRSRRLLPEDSL